MGDFKIELDAIYNRDCLEIMKQFPEKFVDLIVTSPPYNIGKKYDGFYNDDLTNEDYIKFTAEYLSECYKVLKDDGRICVNIGYKVSTVKDKGIDFVQFINIVRSIGYSMRETIIWIKTKKKDNLQNFCGSNTAWGSWLSASNPVCRARMEFIFIFNKKYPKKRNKGISDITKDEFLDCSSNVWYFPAESNRKIHKALFPVELPYRLIKFLSYKNDIILDPFIGSGTTAVACVMANRRYIGIELNKNYCDYAKKRINNAKTERFKMIDREHLPLSIKFSHR